MALGFENKHDLSFTQVLTIIFKMKDLDLDDTFLPIFLFSGISDPRWAQWENFCLSAVFLMLSLKTNFNKVKYYLF